MEDAEKALAREMQEELGVDVCVDRLLWVVENFFNYQDNPYHELGLYFLMSIPKDAGLWGKREKSSTGTRTALGSFSNGSLYRPWTGFASCRRSCTRH